MRKRKVKRLALIILAAAAVVALVDFGFGYPMAFRAGNWRERLGQAPAGKPLYLAAKLIERTPAVKTSPFEEQAAAALEADNVFNRNSPFPPSAVLGLKHYRLMDRQALVAPAPSAIAYPLTIPPGARLEFGYGKPRFLGERRQGGVKFIVEWRDAAGAKMLFEDTVEKYRPGFWDRSKQRERIWYRYLHPALMRWGDAYRDASVDLSSLAGRQGELWFIAEPAEKTADGKFTAALWGNPEVWAERPAAEPAPLNVVLFMIEATPTTVVEPYTENPAVTPHLRKFAERSVVFDKFFTAGDSTQLSTFCYFTGMNYRAMGLPNEMYFLAPMVKARFYRQNYATLAEAFSRSGYQTAQIGSNLFFLPQREIGLDMGFAELDAMNRDYYTSEDTTLAAMEWLRANGSKPFFLYIHYDAPHDETKPVLEDLVRALAAHTDDTRWRMRKYLAQEVSADRAFAHMLEALDVLGLSGRTLVIVTADHGNCLDPAHDFAVLRADRRPWWTPFQHGRSMNAEDTLVPLIIGWPIGSDVGRRVTQPIASIDLFPTLVDLVLPKIDADFKERMRTMDGKSFAALLDPDRAAEAQKFTGRGRIYSVSAGGESLIADGRYHYFRRAPGFDKLLYPGASRLVVKKDGVFDLATDPRELHDLSASRPDLLAAMREAIKAARPHDATLRFIYLNYDQGRVRGRIKLGGTGPLTMAMTYPDGRPAITLSPAAGDTAGNGSLYEFSADLEGPTGLILDRPVEWMIIELGGKRVTTDQARLGPFGLPLEQSSPCGLSDQASSGLILLESCAALPESVLIAPHHPMRFMDEPGVYFYQMKFADFIEESFSDEKLSPAVKSVLKQWGYIE
ncbi:MAG TPA: sulfatase-like hydrolase/transferase [bacterium]|nr:sulfatase-like hydrolase/transferase [bacterium]